MNKSEIRKKILKIRKKEIELNQKSYEKLIDEAANEISNFVEKASLEDLSK